MWIWIIAAAAVVVAWALVLLLSLPLWIAIVATVLALGGAVGVFLFRRLRAQARAAALERELLNQAAKQADRSRPDRRQQILDLVAQMRAAMDALKRTKLAGGGRSALYALPWYVIVGPPGAGKTTALEQSGLAFTSPKSQGPKIRGTAGTRNCDWWFSQHAILLDTAGRFATEAEDRDEWLAFLDTLKKFRSHRPLDGILVAVSVTDLVGADDARIQELAQTLRARVDELMSRLEMVLPVYVLFTKADLVAGFVEFWGDLAPKQRGLPWGATFRLDDKRLAEPARAFEAEFDLLSKVLHARLLDRAPRERLAEARSRILQFPAEFQLLRAPLARFVEELCASNPYQDPPLLRGFYFTSGTQVGRPMDRVLAGMARGFGLRSLPGAEDARPAQQQSYFVTELFRGIIFPDRHLAGRSVEFAKKQTRWQIAAAAVAAVASVGILVWATLSFLSLVDEVRAASAAAAALERMGKPSAAKGTQAELDSLTELLDRVEDLRRENERWRLPGSMTSSPLFAPMRAYYLSRVNGVMVGPVRAELAAEVGQIADLARVDSDNFESAYGDLKLYSMVTAPERLDTEWAAPKLADSWAKAGGPGLDPTKIAKNSAAYLAALAEKRLPPWPADDLAVSRARRRICQQPLEELQLGAVIAAAKAVPPIGYEKIFYGPALQYILAKGKVEVRGEFTKPGWDKIRGVIASPDALLTLDPWVCGDTRENLKDARKANAERLRTVYFDRYARAWTDFLAGITVQAPSDVRSAIDELKTLEPTDGPYVRLFKTVADNATLDMGDPGLLEQAEGKLKQVAAGLLGKDAGTAEKEISPVEREFKPLIKFAFGDGSKDGPPGALSQYLAQLTNLEVSLGQLAQTKAEPTAAFEAEMSRTEASVVRLFGGLDASMRLLIEPLLMAPIHGSQAGVVGAGSSMLSDKWKSEVWELYTAKVAGKYPFVESPNEVSLAEFVEFFRPNAGVLWKFFEANLADKLQRNGNAFTPKEGSQAVAFRPEFLRCLDVAQEITDAVFGASPDPSVAFSVKMQPAGADIAEISLQIDGQAKVYRNEPERWMPAQWPAKDAPARGGTLVVKGAGFTDQIPRMGDFGFFRLLDAGAVKPLSTDNGVPLLGASWTLTRAGQSPIVIQIRPGKSVHPFAHDFFRRLKCPPEAAVALAPEAAARGPGR